MQFLLKHWSVSEHDNVITDTVDNKQHKIEPKTMAVLMLLIRHYDAVVPRDEFCNEVWNGRVTVDESLTRCISELRRIFNDSPKSAQVIKTVHKKGYKLLVRPVEIPPGNNKNLSPRSSVALVGYRKWFAVAAGLVLAGIATYFFADKHRPAVRTQSIEATSNPTSRQFASLSEIRSSTSLLSDPIQTYSWDDPKSGKGYDIVVSEVTSQGVAPNTVRLQIFDDDENMLWDVQRTIDGQDEVQPSLNEIAQVLSMANKRKEAPELTALNSDQHNAYKQAMYLIDKRGKANLDKAIVLLDAVLENRPEFVMALIQKAVAVRNLGFYETGSEQKKQQMIHYELLLKQATAIAPAHPVVNAMTYQFNAESPNWLSYEKVMEDAVRFAPSCIICVRKLAEFYINVGYYEKAEALVVYHLDYFPLSTMMHSFLGQLHSKQGDLDKTRHQAGVLAALKSRDAFDTYSIRFNAAVMEENEHAARTLLDTIVQKHPAFSTHKKILLAQIDKSYEEVKSLIAQMPRVDFNLAITAGSFEKVHQRMLKNISNGQIRDIGLLHGWLTETNSLSRYYPENLLKFKNHPKTVALLHDVGLFKYWEQKAQWPDYCRLDKYSRQRPAYCDKQYL